jgi:hypothetical protein
MLWGPPGIGKSDVVAQVALLRKEELRDTRLNLLDPIDMKGFPVADMESRTMTWLPPDFLPPTFIRKEVRKGRSTATNFELVPNDSKGILFLDEIVSAPQAVQAAAYQLTLNRKIGNYTLPQGWSIIAAGNREGDRSVVHRMPSALANRFVHIEFEVNLDDWCAWALEHDIEAELLAFLRFRPALLHSFDPAQNPKAFPSPRSWMFVNSFLQNPLPPADQFEVIKGTVGEAAAGEFTAFQRTIKNLPSIDKILLQPETTEVPSEPALGTRTAKDNFDRMMKYVNRLPTEFQVVFVRDCVRRTASDPKLDVTATKAFTSWSIDNSSVLV